MVFDLIFLSLYFIILIIDIIFIIIIIKINMNVNIYICSQVLYGKLKGIWRNPLNYEMRRYWFLLHIHMGYNIKNPCNEEYQTLIFVQKWHRFNIKKQLYQSWF